MATQARPVSWTDLSPSVQEVCGWARAATPGGAPLDSAALLLGMVRARPGYSEPEALLSHAGHPLDALWTGLRQVSRKLAVDAEQPAELSALPKLTPEAGRAIEAALRLASAYNAFRDGKVHAPHLFGGILRGSPGAKGREALRAVLRGAAAEASDDYENFLSELVRNRSVSYADFLRRRPLLPPSALPPPPVPFVDREGELSTVLAAVRDSTPAFITGPPGVGKTALALRAAAEAAGRVSDVEYVIGSEPGAEEVVRASVARRDKALLVLDAADALDLDRVLDGTSGLVIATMRRGQEFAPSIDVALDPLPIEDVQRMLRAAAPASAHEADLEPLAKLSDGVPATAVQLGMLLQAGLGVQELFSLLVRRRSRLGAMELSAARTRDAEAVTDLEPRYRARLPHEQRLFRAAGLLDGPFSAAQLALAADTDADAAEIVLADLAAAGLVQEDEGGQWSVAQPAQTLAWSELADQPSPEQTRLLVQALTAERRVGLREEEPTALAGFRSDEPSDVDHIGFSADVDALSSVLIAHKVDPPISVGLFGEWGTGKSTFMRLMRDKIRSLQREWEGQDDSPFCKSVKQITFNAWNYSDANLWASLVTKIFEGLASADPEVGDDVELADAQRAAIVNALETAKATIKEKEAQRGEAVKRERELERRLKRIATAETAAANRLGEIRPADVIAKARKSKKVEALGRAVLSRARLDPADDAVAVARELRSTWGFVAHTGRLLGRKRALEIAAATLLLAGGVALAESLGVPVAGTIAAVTAWVGGIAAVARKPVEQARLAAAAADDLLSGLHEEEQAAVRRAEADVQRELAQLAAQRAQLDSELQEARSAAARASREIDDIKSGRRITQFVEERAASTEYRQYLGLIALIRRDFDQLTKLLLEGKVKNKPPFDRIILYIDDLDRCRADLVVQVLEAVHLLLALKLFVVVVGVDPRWLAQSLKRHYIGQLGLEDGDEPDEDAREWETTPQNYLEKIFQIPFALRPMGTDGYQRMMGALFEVRARDTSTQPTDTGGVSEPGAPRQDEGESVGAAPESDVTATAPEPSAQVLDLLRIWPSELEFIQRLGALVPTPRAANRLANTYRLIRVSQTGPRLATFVSREGEAGEYRVALVLLTIVVGFGDVAHDVFSRLLGGKHRSFWAFVDALDAPPDASTHTAAAYDRLRNGVRELRKGGGLPDDIAVYRGWVSRVARYSFETARMPAVESAQA